MEQVILPELLFRVFVNAQEPDALPGELFGQSFDGSACRDAGLTIGRPQVHENHVTLQIAGADGLILGCFEGNVRQGLADFLTCGIYRSVGDNKPGVRQLQRVTSADSTSRPRDAAVYASGCDAAHEGHAILPARVGATNGEFF